MVQRRQRERSLFEVLLPDGHKLWPDWLRQIDTLLEDEAVIDVVAQALEARWPQSRRRGRPGTPAEVVIRMLILKHLFDWSYDDLEHEVRANLVYRAFTRIDAGDVPDAKTLLKIARAVVRDATTMVRRISQRLRAASRSAATTLIQARQQLQQMQPLVTRVLTQTRARLLGGDTHVPDKVLSVFEPHTEAIRKGKIAKPTEFGKLVTIQESEHQIITVYAVHPTRPADMNAVDARARSPHRDLRACAGSRRRRSWFLVRQERRRRARAWCPTSDSAAAWTENTRPARA
jgi:hypothetical protein